jgi:futalosine hydrolase
VSPDPVTPSGTRLLVVAAVPAERDGILEKLGTAGAVTVIAGGVGMAAAAAGTATALAEADYDVVIAAGIGGGFPGVAAMGQVVVADRIIAADLGATSPAGFLSIEELGFGTGSYLVEPRLAEAAERALRRAGLPVVTGPALTVSTVTGTVDRAEELAARHPGAAVEGMEGFGVATAATARAVPVLEIRAVSNPVGPRDRSAWRIPEALAALAAAVPAVAEELCR